MTYCLGIVTKDGLVMASDSRTNAGYDQVNVCRKMHTFQKTGELVFVMLASGSLSCTQSIVTLLRREFDAGKGLAAVTNMYDAARIVAVSDERRPEEPAGARIEQPVDAALLADADDRARASADVGLEHVRTRAGEVPHAEVVFPRRAPARPCRPTASARRRRWRWRSPASC